MRPRSAGVFATGDRGVLYIFYYKQTTEYIVHMSKLIIYLSAEHASTNHLSTPKQGVECPHSSSSVVEQLGVEVEPDGDEQGRHVAERQYVVGNTLQLILEWDPLQFPHPLVIPLAMLGPPCEGYRNHANRLALLLDPPIKS